MKALKNMFISSANELKKPICIVVTGMLLGVALILRTIAIQVTEDIRITFAFLAIGVIAMLYGPVVAALANFANDLLGYILGNNSARGYYPPLALVAIIAGLIYGVVLYRKEIKIFNIVLARIMVVVLCNLVLNSIFIYTGFVNKHFDITNTANLNAFFIWFTPRLIKNAIQLPFDIVMMIILYPIVYKVYNKMFSKKAEAI